MEIKELLQAVADEMPVAGNLPAQLRRRIRRRRALTAALGGILSVAMVLAGYAAARFALGPDFSGRPASLNPDSRNAACLSPNQPGLITCEEALRLADKTGYYSKRASKVEAKLTNYRRRPGADPIRAWVVTFYDVPTPVSGPACIAGEECLQGPSCVLGEWGVALRATDGKFLAEGGEGDPNRPCPSEGGIVPSPGAPERGIRPSPTVSPQTPEPSAPSDASGLLIRNVREVGPPNERGFQEIRFDILWASDSFPGTRRCTVEAYGADGSKVGEDTTDVMSMLPKVTEKSDLIRVSAPAASFDASCGPRLDVGNPYAYEFSDLRIESTRTIGTVGEAVVSYQVRWLGKGEPGVVECTWSLYDSSGDLIHRRETTFTSGRRRLHARSRIWSGALARATPVRAEIACSPFKG